MMTAMAVRLQMLANAKITGEATLQLTASTNARMENNAQGWLRNDPVGTISLQADEWLNTFTLLRLG
jgi:hypothetical protein